MPNPSTPTRIAVIAGSRRPNRRSRAIAEWVRDAPAAAGVELALVDLDEVGLPPLAEPSPAAFGQYTLEHTRRWSELIDRFDGYVLVTPEYNHSTTAALKDALDYLYREWQDKAVAFVGYGTDGGVRAVEHLRGITAELGLAGIGPSVALSIFDDFDRAGALAVRERQEQLRARMLLGLYRWANALRTLRAAATDEIDSDPGQPADPGEPAEPATPGRRRPALNDASEAATAHAATQALIERLQNGLDGGDADLYDSMFAEDVLWGSPYGQVLAGYAPLNSVHRSMMNAPAAGHSRYEIVHTSTPAAGVLLAHVRRRSLRPGQSGSPEFSEMALYVLIHRNGRWWLAAGQNTPIRVKPSAVASAM